MFDKIRKRYHNIENESGPFRFHLVMHKHEGIRVRNWSEPRASCMQCIQDLERSAIVCHATRDSGFDIWDHSESVKLLPVNESDQL